MSTNFFFCTNFLTPPPQGCERAGPAQGSESPKLEKEGLGVKKLPFPSAPEKGARLESENPHFFTGHDKENGDFLTQNALFWGAGKFDSVQTRCIVKGEAQKSPLFR